jgi:hypothetical protein
MGVAMNPGSASTWIANWALTINPSTNLGTNHVANAFEVDVANRSTNVGDTAGIGGITFLGGNVTGETMTGSGYASSEYAYRNTYAYGVSGPGNMAAGLTTGTASAGGSTVQINNAIFATGDGIRIIEGSATKGLNGTTYIGTVTGGGGTTTITVSPTLTANVSIGDWVDAPTGQTAAAIWNRGFACLYSTVQSCLAIYSAVERGIDFTGSATDIGIDFAGMTGLHTAGASPPVDVRFGPSHEVTFQNAAGTADEVLWTFDANNIWNIKNIGVWGYEVSLGFAGSGGYTAGTNGSNISDFTNNLYFDNYDGGSFIFRGASTAVRMTLSSSAATFPNAVYVGSGTTSGSTPVQITETTNTAWTAFGTLGLAVATHSAQSAIAGYSLNDAASSTNALPAGVNGWGNVTGTGNQTFGLYGLGTNNATAGVAIGAEVTSRNFCGSPDTNLPPNEAIGTGTCVANGLQVTSGGTYGNSVGVTIGAEGGSSEYFNTGLYIRAGIAQFPIFVEATASGNQTTAVLQNNGTGINLQLQTTGSATPSNTVITALNASNASVFSVRQNGDIYSASSLNFSGALPTGTAATYACFTAGGKLISSAAPC